MRRSHDWRLPAITVAAGALLALLAILLAWWSKGLLKEAARAECATRAAALGLTIRRELDERVRQAIRGGERPPEVAAVYRVRGRVVTKRDPADAPPPSPVLLRAVGMHDGAGDLPIVLPGQAATFVPTHAGSKGDGHLVLWNLEQVRERIVTPRLAQDDRYAAALLGPDRSPPFKVRGEQALHPPLSSWSIGVGLTDPSGVRRNLRLQTALLGMLATWLLLALAAGVWLITRRERARVERQKTRERFLARAYHELQTPLALMRASAESMQRGAVQRPEDLDRCVAIMAREEERLTRTIRRLLRYLQFESGPAPGDERASLVEEVTRTVEEARPSLEAHGLKLELTAGEIDPALQASRELVADTLQELFANARKYAEGATTVAVTLTALGPSRAALSVRDDGPGVSDPESIFAPWEGEAGQGGSGLGLALLREGWEALGGSIRCASPPGAGAEFVVTIPLER